MAPNARGACWILLGALSLVMMHALGKDLGKRYDPMQMTFFRCVVSLALVFPFAIRGGLAKLRTRHLKMHIVRSLFGLLAWIAAFYAVARLPLADFTTMSFSMPLFITLLAVPVLGDRGSWQRWLATVVGFAGVVLTARPGAEFQLATLVALAGAFAGACVLMVVKKTPMSETPVAMLFHSNLILAVMLVLPALAVWRTPELVDLLLLVLVGLFGIGAQAGYILAMREGDASALAPFDYVRLIYAGLIGFVLFAEVPDHWSLLGAALIIGSTFYIGRHEGRLARAAAIQ
ncbi:DMT family transporter [Piscinibacter sakaiensis]|uniref:DMT family transporter n=1 Tax=Piscinibacter sakaiensis TaxID=1547922 RepID=UPI003AAAF14F